MKKLACLLLACLLLPGCAGRVELSLMAVALGVDADENGVTLTVKAPDYSAASREKDAQKGYLTLSAAGSDWTEAVAHLMASAPLEIRFGQLREVVIGSGALARRPLKELLRQADQLPNVRSHAQVILCPGEARALVEAQQPLIGKRLSKYLDISMQHAQEQGDIPGTTLACALRDLSGPWRCPVLTCAEAGAEGVAYDGGWAVSAEGVPAYLSGREVQLFRLASGEAQSLVFAAGGRYYAVSPRGSARRMLRGGPGKERLLLRLPVTVTYSVYDGAPDEDAQAEARETLRRELLDLLRKLQAAGCDALGFGCLAVRGYADLDAWLKSGWPRRYAQAELELEIDARFRQERLI